ncbi:hypothetical protein K2Z84_12995 [Candidatus Binatia bacterium]|nr:hypothetical protein [Candidatus Binatia bacterium]
MTLDSVDSVFAGFAAFGAGAFAPRFGAAAFFAFPAVPFAVAGALVFFGFSAAVVRAALGAAAFAGAAALGAAAFAGVFTGAFFATGAFATDFLLVFFAPLAAMPFLHVSGVLCVVLASPGRSRAIPCTSSWRNVSRDACASFLSHGRCSSSASRWRTRAT